jgi:PST family polysaccharide transporter
MSSYRQIFKSTAVIGAAQVANIGIGIVRNKALAVFLAPAGFGLAGTYLTVTGFVGGVTGLGLGMSGVRQIAEAAAGGDQNKIARTIQALRWASLLSGILGMVVLLALCVPLSYSTFGNGNHAGAIALMSLSLLFGGISTGQYALIQGLRRLVDLGKSQVAGAFFGMLASVALVYYLRERGIALYLVANAAMAVLFSYWYARKIEIPRIKMRLGELWFESRGLLTLGFAFLIQNLVLGLGGYLTRVLIISHLGLAAVGFYTAAWTLSSYYVGMVLKAMGADFYPRLTAIANDHPTMNRLVNEQIEMGLLISVPGILAILTLAPWALHLFYSGAFESGAGIIRWQVLGVFVQVFSWPIGLIQLGKGRARLIVISEALSTLFGLGFLFIGLRLWKLDGIGIAFLAYAFVMAIVVWLIGARLIGFTWTPACLRLLALSCLSVLGVFLMTLFLPPTWSLAGGLISATIVSFGSYVALQKLLGVNLRDLVVRKLGLSNGL